MRKIQLVGLMFIIVPHITITKDVFDYFKEYAKNNTYDLKNLDDVRDYVSMAKRILKNQHPAIQANIETFEPTTKELQDIQYYAGQSYASSLAGMAGAVIGEYTSPLTPVTKIYGYPEEFNTIRQDFYIDYIKENEPSNNGYIPLKKRWQSESAKNSYLRKAREALSQKHGYLNYVLGSFGKADLKEIDLMSLLGKTASTTEKPKQTAIEAEILNRLEQYAKNNKFTLKDATDKHYYLVRFKQLVEPEYKDNKEALDILKKLSSTDRKVNKILTEDAKVQEGYRVLFGYFGQETSPIDPNGTPPPIEFINTKYEFYRDYITGLTTKPNPNLFDYNERIENYINKAHRALENKYPYLAYVLKAFNLAKLTGDEFEELYKKSTTASELAQKSEEKLQQEQEKKQEEQKTEEQKTEEQKIIKQDSSNIKNKEEQQDESQDNQDNEEVILVEKKPAKKSVKKAQQEQLLSKLQVVRKKVEQLKDYRAIYINNFVVETLDTINTDINDISWKKYTKKATNYVEQNLNLKKITKTYLNYFELLSKAGINKQGMVTEINNMQKGVTAQELSDAAKQLTNEEKEEEESDDEDNGDDKEDDDASDDEEEEIELE